MATLSFGHERREIEQEFQEEILPGTEIMTDIGSHHFVKSRDTTQTVLVPQPSEDPHDPLNWTDSWKIAAITASSWVTFTQGFAPLSLAPQFPYYMEAFNCSLADAVQFTGVCILVLGFSNFIWVPISTSFGRRPVLIASQCVCFASMIWRAQATSYASFMGACVLNGIGAGPAETIQPAVIADIFFLHVRGRWNTLYWVVYMGSLMVAPIISGPMAYHVGWRHFWWLNVAMTGLSIIMVIFMFPETKWNRADPRGSQTASSSTAGTGEKGDTPKPENANTENADTENAKIVEKPAPSSTDPEETLTRSGSTKDPYLGRGTPSKDQFRLFTPNAHPWRSIGLDIWIPFKLFAFPIVEFSSFVVLSAPPYNWSPQSVGFTNFAILIGAIVGLATAGPLSDRVSDHATRRNHGIREPEMRLPAMIPYVVIMYLGNIVVSVGYAKMWPWQAIVVIGFVCAGLQVAAIPSIVSTYAVDSYKPVAGSLFVSITINKNVWGYGFSKFITPWSEKNGFIPPIMTNASLILLWCLCGIAFYYHGKTFRRWSKNSNVHRL